SRRRITRRKISLGRWARLLRESAINASAFSRRCCSQQFYSGSVRRNCFILACASRRESRGLFCLSSPVHVSISCGTSAISLGLKWRVDIKGSGGLIGYRLADEHRGLLRAALGPVGSVLLVLGIYATTLILVTGLRPIHLVRETVSALQRAATRLREWQLQRKLRRLDLKEKLEISERQLAKQRRALEKQLKKKGMPLPETMGAAISPEELANLPEPKVVDTTALPSEHVTPVGRKPSLAELRARDDKPRPDSSVESATSTWENYALP